MQMITFLALWLYVHAFVLCKAANEPSSGGKNNNELSVVMNGIEDRNDILVRRLVIPPKDLLCVTFANSKVDNKILVNNIKQMGKRCDWAVIYYDDNEEQISKNCAALPLKHVIHCAMFPFEQRYGGEQSVLAENITVAFDNKQHLKRRQLTSSSESKAKYDPFSGNVKAEPIKLVTTIEKPTESSTTTASSSGKTEVSARRSRLRARTAAANDAKKPRVYNGPAHIPKSVLYRAILPYLPNYHRVFVMDEDISLLGFNYQIFSRAWDCSFIDSPLIVQPLIAESTPQKFPYLNADAWKDASHADILASAVGFIDQQVSLFDAVFFDWFIQHVLISTYAQALKEGSDGAFDRLWCNAAQMYASVVLKRTDVKNVCAVFPQGTDVHHVAEYSSKEVYRPNDNVEINKQYSNLFPSWVINESINSNSESINPLIASNDIKYRKVKSLDETCVVNRRVSSNSDLGTYA